MDFDDHSIIYMCHGEPSGNRPLEEGVRVWHDADRGHDWLGRPEWSHDAIAGTRLLSGSRITFPDATTATPATASTNTVSSDVPVASPHRTGGRPGYGFYEHGFFGPFEKMNLHDVGDLFP